VAVTPMKSVSAIAPEWKLHRDLANDVIRPWSVISESVREDEANGLSIETTVVVYVLFHADIDLEQEGAALLTKHGGSVRSYIRSLNGVVAQRLARTICTGCSTKYYPSEDALMDAGIPEFSGRAFRKGLGCQQCHDSGYQGRLGIYEVMAVTPEMRRMVHRAAPTFELREQQTRAGMLSLRQEGVALAVGGRTNLEEVLRVTQCDDVHAEEHADEQGAMRRDAA